VNADQFRARLKATFSFDRSGRSKLGNAAVLAFVAPRKAPLELTRLERIVLDDTKNHFAAEVIMGAGTCEIIHVTEPGRFRDHVFWSDHHRLYALEFLEDPEETDRAFRHLGINRKKYQAMSNTQRIAAMPFVKHRLAPSLQKFFDGIRSMPKCELYDAVEPKRTKPHAAIVAPLKHAKAITDSHLYLESRKLKQFFQIGARDRGLFIVSGTRGKRGRSQFKRAASMEAALVAGEALIEQKLAKGFRPVKV